ncbi:MAG: hypothetical protein ACKOC5_07675, partial [Chloroflexota bacterium]
MPISRVRSKTAITGMLITERVYARMSIDSAITLTLLSFVVTLLAALYPALLAARMEPVTALHGGD